MKKKLYIRMTIVSAAMMFLTMIITVVTFYNVFSEQVMEDLKTDERIAERIYAVSVPVIMPEVNVRRKMADKHTKEFINTIMQE